MKVNVYLDPAIAIRACKSRVGQITLNLTDDDLAILTPEQRDELARVQGIGTDRADTIFVDDATIAGLAIGLDRRRARRLDREAKDNERKAIAEAKAVESAKAVLEAYPDEESLLVKSPYPQYHWAVKNTYHDTGTSDEWVTLHNRILAIVANAKLIASERNAEIEAKDLADFRERQETRKAERRAYDADRAGWICTHGSERLRFMLAEGFALERTYIDERRAKERPGWVFLDDTCGWPVDIRDPSEAALKALIDARKEYSDVYLKWLSDDEHIEGCPHPDTIDFVQCPVLQSEFLGRCIIRFIDGGGAE
jgi:hypothetical protein